MALWRSAKVADAGQDRVRLMRGFLIHWGSRSIFRTKFSRLQFGLWFCTSFLRQVASKKLLYRYVSGENAFCLRVGISQYDCDLQRGQLRKRVPGFWHEVHFNTGVSLASSMASIWVLLVHKIKLIESLRFLTRSCPLERVRGFQK